MSSLVKPLSSLSFDLGTFEGFNFREQSAIEQILSVTQAVQWDHDRLGEAEFWPAGDHAGVSAIFSDCSNVTASELIALDQLLHELGGDSLENFLRIRHSLSLHGCHLSELSREQIEEDSAHIFIGKNFADLRRDAAYELFESYWPAEYAMWEKCNCDGLIFDTDRFLDSPSRFVDEVDLGDTKALIVTPY